MSSALQEQFANDLAKFTRLDPRVVFSWAQIEGAYAQGGTGNFNFLNLRAGPGGAGYSGVPESSSPAGFAQFRSLADAEKETAHWLQSFSNYSGIRASEGGTPRAEIDAIAASPWDAGHYTRGGVQGQALLDTFTGLFGSSALGKPGGTPIDPGSKDPRLNPGAKLPQGEPGGLPGLTPHDPTGGAVSGAVGAVESIGSFLGKLTDPNFLLRALQVVGGGVVTLAGLVLLVKQIGLSQVIPKQASNAPGVKQTADTVEENDPVADAYEKGRQQGREARARAAGRRRESRPARQRTAERSEARSRSAASERRNRIAAESASIPDEVPF